MKHSAPCPIVSLHIAPAFALLAALGLTACHPPAAPIAPKLDPKIQAKAHRERAQSSAQLAAEGLHSAALGATGRVYAEIPEPPWSHFPGLKGQRVRAPLTYAPPQTPGPVMVIMLDTTRADSLSAYGYDRPTTPNIDKLAQEGVRFSRFYSNGAWTRPSVASIMTSEFRSEHNTEVFPGTLPDDKLTAAEIYKNAGYATAGFIGNQTVHAKYGFGQGFDRYDDVFDELEHDPPATDLVRRAIRWIDNNKNPQWFMWLFAVDPHEPYTPERAFDRFETTYKARRVPIPDQEYADKYMPTPEHIERMKALYDAEILEMDTALGKLFDHLRAKGLWDNLTVIVVADHGEAFGEHNTFLHAYHFWEPNLNVPLIIRSPSLPNAGGLIEDRLFQSVDVLPTMLDLSGLSYPEGFTPSGQSAARLLSGPITEGWDRATFTELDAYGIRRDMIRRGDYKFVRAHPTFLKHLKHFFPSRWRSFATVNHTNTREFLYNIAEDPAELTNLIEQRPTIAREMGRQLDTFKGTGAVASDEGLDEIPELSEEELEDLRKLGYVE